MALNWVSFSSFYKDFSHFAVIQQFPSFVDDERIWGRPNRYLPYPELNSWEISVFMYISKRIWFMDFTGWMEVERHCARSLDDVLPILNDIWFYGNRLVINLEQWQWTYEDGWEPFDYI